MIAQLGKYAETMDYFKWGNCILRYNSQGNCISVKLLKNRLWLKTCDIYENSHVGLFKRETRSFWSVNPANKNLH